MAQAKHGDTVKVHYTVQLVTDGATVDTTSNREPLEFTIGAGRIIPGFEEAVVGMNPGETKSIEIPAEKAFGSHRKERVVVADRSHFPAETGPQVGQMVQLQVANGETIPAKVTEVSESHVTLDANHPLAGNDLHCEVNLVAIV